MEKLMDIRDEIITGTFYIGSDGRKEPTDWKEYAAKLENKIKSQTFLNNIEGWISVNDRLPEILEDGESELVLCVGRKGNHIKELLAETIESDWGNDTGDDTEEVYRIIMKLDFEATAKMVNDAILKVKCYKLTKIQLIANES
jgi:hypothetical protein